MKIKFMPTYSYVLVLIIASLTGVWCVLSNTSKADIIGLLIVPNLPVLISQSLFLIILFKQITNYNSINPLISIRNKMEFMQIVLFKIITLEVILYFLIYYLSFVFYSNSLFRDGNMIVGILILLLRFLMLFILSIVILGAYHYKNSNMLIIIALIINIFYHYVVEIKWLLIIYSPIYDPLYNAVNRNS